MAGSREALAGAQRRLRRHLDLGQDTCDFFSDFSEKKVAN